MDKIQEKKNWTSMMYWNGKKICITTSEQIDNISDDCLY
jgi:hypothetical protein